MNPDRPAIDLLAEEAALSGLWGEQLGNQIDAGCCASTVGSEGTFLCSTLPIPATLSSVGSASSVC